MGRIQRLDPLEQCDERGYARAVHWLLGAEGFGVGCKKAQSENWALKGSLNREGVERTRGDNLKNSRSINKSI
jgi:hypothetical protein